MRAKRDHNTHAMQAYLGHRNIQHTVCAGARLVMPLGPAHAPQQLTVIEKIAPSETRMRSIILVGFAPFTRSQD